MSTLFLLLNHTLTAQQKADAKVNFSIDTFLALPTNLQKIWSSVSPEGELDIKSLKQISRWLSTHAKKGDYLLIQGEFGATFYMVEFCFSKGFVPLYSTSKREYKEEYFPDGSVKRQHLFKHIQYRPYCKYDEE